MAYNFGVKQTSPQNIPAKASGNFGFGIKKESSKTPAIEEIQTKTLPSFLGGGTYKLKVGDPNALIKTERTNYGGLPAKTGFERADVIPVSLGGVNKSKENIQYESFLPEVKKLQEQGKPLPIIKTATDKKLMEDILPKYDSGEMGLREAQVTIQSYLRNEQEGLNKKIENINLGGKLGELSDKVVGFFKGLKAKGEAKTSQDIKNIATTEQRIKQEESKKIEEEKNLTPAQKIQRNDPLLIGAAKLASEVTGKEIKPENYLQEEKKISPEQKRVIETKINEQAAEKAANIFTAPIRFTAGMLARDVITLGLEKAKSDIIITPKNDIQKLLLGKEDIERITNSKDLYGLIAKNAGVISAVVAMTALDNPFLLGSGKSVSSAVNKVIDNKIAKLLIESGTIPSVQKKIAEAEIRKLAKEGLEMTAKEISEGTAERLAQIEAKKVISSADEKEVQFLIENSDKPEKIAKEYGIKIKEEPRIAPVVEKSPKTTIDTIFGKKPVSEAPIQPELTLKGEPKASISKKEAKVPQGTIISTKDPIPKNIEPSVVQILDTKSGVVEYKVISKGELPKFHNLIDDTKKGIAGKEIDGKIYHLTAKTPEQMDKVGAIRTGTAKISDIPESKLPKVITKQEKITEILSKEKLTPSVKTPSAKRLESSVYKRLKDELPEELRKIPEYNRINLKKDAERAVKLIEKDKQRAMRVALGYEDAPANQTSTAVNIALSEKARREGNHALQGKLIKTRSLAQTKRGQEIVAEKGSITNNSSDRYIKELISAKLDKLGNKYLDKVNMRRITGQDTAKTSASKKIASEVKKVEKTFKELDIIEAQKLIDSLSCDY